MSPLIIQSPGNQDAPVSGAVVYWRLRGDVPLQTIQTAVGAVDPALTPHGCGPRAAIQRACANAWTGAHRFKRPIPKGWALIDEESVGQDDLSHRVAATVTLDSDGVPDIRPRHLWEGDAIRRAYEDELGVLAVEEASLWLVRVVMPAVDGVALREGGGVYFVPQHALARFEALVQVLHQYTQHRVYVIAAHSDTASVSAVLDAVVADAEKALAEIQDGVADVGERALNARKVRLAALSAKLGRYSALLGDGLDAVEAQAEEVDAALAVIVLGSLGGDQVEKKS